jgi:pimeloyl-ACP methyl ester carboxylesterase
MFRNVIPKLSKQFRVIAPGFGFSGVPSKEDFEYTFENFARIIGQFLLQLGVRKTSFYLFDYGVPIIVRVIATNPLCVQILIF